MHLILQLFHIDSACVHPAYIVMIKLCCVTTHFTETLLASRYQILDHIVHKESSTLG